MEHHMEHHMQRHDLSLQAGFTLIELLVAISIIGVLAAMLLPMVAKASASARNIKCQSSLRQIGMGVEAYTMDSDGITIPVVRQSGSAGVNWFTSLMPYLNARTAASKSDTRAGVFNGCPEWQGRYQGSGAFANASFGYGLNGYAGLPTITASSNFRSYNPATRRGEWGRAQEFTAGNIEYSSQRMLVADSNDWHCYGVHSGGIVNKRIEGGWSTYIGKRHGEKINVLFFDGHVASLPYVQARMAIVNPALVAP